jgi:type I restriction enzyme S subunit
MTDWRETTLGQFVSLQRGHDLPAEQRRAGSVPVMGSFGITGWHDQARAPGPGVTVGRSGASVGVVSYIDCDYWPLNTCLFATNFHGNNPRFVYYFLQTLDLAAHNSGSAQPSLNRNYISPIKIFVPDPGIQNDIVNLLGSLDDKIELNRRMNETLEAMAQAIFRDWFVDFGPTLRKLDGATDPVTVMGGLMQDTERAQAVADLFPAALGDDGLPEGWKRKALLEEARLISGGTPKTDRQDYWDGGIPWASAKDVSQCGETLLLDTERKITQSGLANSSTKMVPKFSTAVVARGATTGRYCMLAEDMAMNQTCYALHSASGRPFLLYNMFGALIGELVQAAHGSVFDTITTKTLATGFVIDAEGVAAEFEKTAAPLYAAIDNNSRQSRTLAATRDLLLPKLMSGEIRISEADDLMEAAQ